MNPHTKFGISSFSHRIDHGIQTGIQTNILLSISIYLQYPFAHSEYTQSSPFQ